MLHRITALLVGVVLGATLTVAGPSTAKPTDDSQPFTVAQQLDSWFAWTFNRLPDCATEDSDNCRWDADIRGNGRGVTFVALNGKRYGTDGRRIEHRFTAPKCDRYGQWRKVPHRLVGVRVDGVTGGSFRVTARSCWHVGATTYVITPRGRVGIS